MARQHRETGPAALGQLKPAGAAVVQTTAPTHAPERARAHAMTRKLPEHERAKQWRQAIGLTIGQLAERTGFDPGSIADIEAGRQRKNGAPISPTVMRRYRMACAAVDAGAEAFDWG